jgi:thioredoxin-related protein
MMKRMHRMMLLTLALSGLAFGVEWAEGFDAAVKQAAKEHKIVMVMVVSQECRWCKKMKHRTLSDERVEQKLKQFVSVQVMEDDTNVMKQLPQINGVPTIFFMRPEGKVIQDVVGYFNVGDFLSYLSDVEKMTGKRQ